MRSAFGIELRDSNVFDWKGKAFRFRRALALEGGGAMLGF